MSPSHPERLQVAVGRNGLLVFGETPRTIALQSSDAPLDETLPALLRQFLAEAKPRSVEILLSSGLVDTVVVPGLEHWLTDDDLKALGRSKLAAFYGTTQDTREVAVGREAYGVPGLAMSVSRRLLDGLRASVDGRSLGLRPLAAATLEKLAKELRQLQPTAIWIEEADSLWIGLRADGQWRSARTLPGLMLRHASRNDLLQRECLAAGLVGVEQIYYLAIGTTHPEGWGTQATDCSDRLAGPRKGADRVFAFGAKSCPRLGWAVLAAALAAIGATAYAWIDSQAEYAAASDALVLHRQVQSQASEAQRAADEALQADYARAWSAYRLQRLPWGELFTALNESGGDAVGLTGFKADALDGTLALEGEAKRFEDVQAFADALGLQPPVRGVRIASMAPGGETNGGRVKFALAASWRAVLSREASQP